MSRSRGEWPLVGFTLLGQAAAGMFVSLGAARLLVGGAVADDALARILRGPVVAVGVMLLAALLLSTRHLARPSRAWRALRRVNGSWVSAEVLLGAGFAAAGACFAAVEVFRLGPGAVGDWLGGLAAALGLGFVAAMGRIYRLPARPAWNHPVTSVGFFTTAAWLGTLAAAASLVGAARWSLPPASLYPDYLVAVDRAVGWLAAAAVASAILDLGAAVVQYRVRCLASRGASLPELPRLLRRHRRVGAVRLGLTLLATLAAGSYAFREPAWSALEGEGAALIACALVLAAGAATAGRVMFYVDRPRAGL